MGESATAGDGQTESETTSVGRLIRRSDAPLTSKLLVIDEIDNDGIAVTNPAGRPSCCPYCGRSFDQMKMAPIMEVLSDYDGGLSD